MVKVLTFLAMAFFCVPGLSVKAQSQVVPFDSDRWEIQAHESKVIDYLGRRSLSLKGGVAVVKDSQFRNGVIEFDIAFAPERGYMGALWRMQDWDNYENFYVRPHQSGNPDATQYQPMINGHEGWQLYYGEGYSAPVKYEYNQWIHIKITVSGKNAEVYIKDMQTPALFINELKRDIQSGRVGLTSGDIDVTAHFSNFSFVAMNNPPLKGKAQAPESAPPGTVMSWMVSNAIEGKSLERKNQLTEGDQQKLQWQKLACESTGLANLGPARGWHDDVNTVFARVTIRSDRDQIKKVSFGFSDEVKVYLNGQLIYGGSDVYRSRDYRFLGTIGLFDELYLPLKKGNNELWLAVTEYFGGWGVEARFENLEGIKIE